MPDPSDDEKEQLLRDFKEAVEQRNFCRAEKIARTINQNEEEISALQKKAIRQFIIEYRNPQGAIALAEEYRFTREDLNQFLMDILQEAREKKILEKKQFDIKTMRYLTLEEWIKEYLY